MDEEEYEEGSDLPVKRFDWRVLPAACFQTAADLLGVLAQNADDMAVILAADINWRMFRDQSRDFAGEVINDINVL